MARNAYTEHQEAIEAAWRNRDQGSLSHGVLELVRQTIALIIKKFRDEKTDARTALNELLR